jgi:hypothetical protein
MDELCVFTSPSSLFLRPYHFLLDASSGVLSYCWLGRIGQNQCNRSSEVTGLCGRRMLRPCGSTLSDLRRLAPFAFRYSDPRYLKFRGRRLGPQPHPTL